MNDQGQHNDDGREATSEVAAPVTPCTIHRQVKHEKPFDRRAFMQMAAGTGAAVAATGLLPDEFMEARAAPATGPAGDKGMKLLQAA